MNAHELRRWIIIPTLKIMGLYVDSTTKEAFESESQVRLLLGTVAQESSMGEHLRQLGFEHYNGGAFGIYQIETATHNLVLEWLQNNKENIYEEVCAMRSDISTKSLSEHLIFNLYYATAIARSLYLSINEPLPTADDVDGLASYYKRFYNRNGKATEQQFIDNFHKYGC
jgi:hypothetical protein